MSTPTAHLRKKLALVAIISITFRKRTVYQHTDSSQSNPQILIIFNLNPIFHPRRLSHAPTNLPTFSRTSKVHSCGTLFRSKSQLRSRLRLDLRAHHRTIPSTFCIEESFRPDLSARFLPSPTWGKVKTFHIHIQRVPTLLLHTPNKLPIINFSLLGPIHRRCLTLERSTSSILNDPSLKCTRCLQIPSSKSSDLSLQWQPITPENFRPLLYKLQRHRSAKSTKSTIPNSHQKVPQPRRPT